jgi:threonine/homoserine/homoserine lactone efflux protein
VTLELFLRGLAIGFAIAFALGPIGLLVIRRTVDRGWSYGFLSGVGVATTDAMYGAVAAFGLTAITELLVGMDRLLGIVGGSVLVVLAGRSLLAVVRLDPGAGPVARRDRGRIDGPLAAWASMVALTATNPATILSFAALFASIGAGTGGGGGAVAVVVGVFTGSVAWWALLTGAIAGLRARMTARVVRWLNILSAALIGGFGVVAILIGIAG